jgi:hypothetical protein
MGQHTPADAQAQASAALAAGLAGRLETFLAPLLLALDGYLDKRLVRTLGQLVGVIIQFRHSTQGLLLSELGGSLLSPAQAPAGTKRISNLLRCRHWAHAAIERFLWGRAGQYLAQLEGQGHDVLALWDESVLEKPESLAIEGLGAVRSSQAARLTHIKPGYYHPPGGRPVFVPGMQWLGLLLAGYQGPVVLASMRWWTRRGPFASDRRHEEGALLQQCALAWGQRVLHVFDRGFAGRPWLAEVLGWHLRFVLRWPKGYQLLDASGQLRPAWQIAQGQRSWGQRQLWDTHRRCWRKTGVVAMLVRHPEHPQPPLWLVVSRPGQGREPWYLLTSEPVALADNAWQVVLAYSRRWQIEMAWRYSKSELAMESPRLWAWESRLKLLLIASLAYAFLLSLLDPLLAPLREWLLRTWCHRTGERSQDALAPLYRLRSALSRLWLAYPPPPLTLLAPKTPG